MSFDREHARAKRVGSGTKLKKSNRYALELHTSIMSPQELLNAAMQLPEKERLELAAQLLKSVPGDLADTPINDDEFYEELRRRSQDETGQVSAADIWNEPRSF